MMLCVDGSDISFIFFALASREGESLLVISQKETTRTLGDELRVLETFLREQDVVFGEINEVGVVVGPGSAGALRSTLSLVNAWALGRGILVQPVLRTGMVWTCEGSPKPFVLPVYDRPVHTTPTQKDALGRRTLL